MEVKYLLTFEMPNHGGGRDYHRTLIVAPNPILIESAFAKHFELDLEKDPIASSGYSEAEGSVEYTSNPCSETPHRHIWVAWTCKPVLVVGEKLFSLQEIKH